MKSTESVFRAKLDRVLHGLKNLPTKADRDVWLRAGTKANGTEYWKISLCYVDDVLVINKHLKLTIEGLKRTFRLKGDNVESPTMYLKSNLKIIENESGYKCYTMSLYEYVYMAVQTI